MGEPDILDYKVDPCPEMAEAVKKLGEELAISGDIEFDNLVLNCPQIHKAITSFVAVMMDLQKAQRPDDFPDRS